MESFFLPFGLPKLIVVDAEGVFAGLFKQLFQLLGIPVLPVARENHKAVRNERFHRYLNKVQKLHAANKASMHQWRIGTSFATYSWNTAPSDGTDLERALITIGRSFPFPIEIPQNPGDGGGGEEQEALEHFVAWLPLLQRQRQLF
eukprot:14358442-Ditylum_brightwellii.AAC.1